jgi:hypothetical protein
MYVFKDSDIEGWTGGGEVGKEGSPIIIIRWVSSVEWLHWLSESQRRRLSFLLLRDASVEEKRCGEMKEAVWG